MPPRLSVCLLGPLDVRLDDAPVSGFEYNKVRALLAYLAVEASQPHSRGHLCALLWPEAPERSARQNLSQALSRLRQALGDGGSPPPYLITTTEAIQLNPAAEVEVDVRRFSALIQAAEAHAAEHRGWHVCSPCAERLREAAGLYRGDFLAQFYLGDSAPFEEWALLVRERLRQRMLGVLERLAQHAAWRCNYSQAAEYGLRQADLEPLLEINQRNAMRLLTLGGQRAAALAQFEHLRRTLAAELGTEPEAETLSLYEQIRAGTLPEPAHGGGQARSLPAPPTRLIGREAEAAEAIRRLGNGQVRALTLTGPPGIGKTRLALEAAHRLRFDFEDGACFVDLAPLPEASLVPAAVAEALGVQEEPGKALRASVAATLSKRHLLLVLDNFEHVLEAAAFAAELLAACPGVKLLVTSRAALGIRAEQQFELAPLPLPAEGAGMRAVGEAASVQLFVERAQAVRPGFALTADNAEAVARLCARADGLPLAIELIAARLRSLGPDEVLQRFELGREAPPQGARDLPERQWTLRAAIAWSYDRLSTVEQKLFDHLGVFAGGCTADSAQAVAGDGANVLPALESLHATSLVQAHTTAGETRFTLLETIREFAAERLAARGEREAARRRHADYFIRLAERAQPALDGPEQNRWLDRLESEHDNLRAALAWAAGKRDDSGLRLAAALGRFWYIRGHLTEGRSWLARALEARAPAPWPLRGRALEAAGALASRQGDHAGARALHEEALAGWRQLEDGGGITRNLRGLGNVAANLGDNVQAKAYYEESLEIAREAGDALGVAAALNNLGLVAADQGEVGAARAAYRESLGIARTLGDQVLTGNLLLNLGLMASDQGESAEAQPLLEESLALFRGIGHKWGVALALLNLGNQAEWQAQPEAAERCFQESLALYRELGDPVTGSYPLFGLGHVAYERGEHETARRLFAESLRLRHKSGEKRPITRNLEGLAQVERAQGRPARAARLFGAAEALREALEAPITPAYRPEYEREVDALRAALGEAVFQQEWAAGRELGLEEAVRLAAGEEGV